MEVLAGVSLNLTSSSEVVCLPVAKLLSFLLRTTKDLKVGNIASLEGGGKHTLGLQKRSFEHFQTVSFLGTEVFAHDVYLKDELLTCYSWVMFFT